MQRGVNSTQLPSVLYGSHVGDDATKYRGVPIPRYYFLVLPISMITLIRPKMTGAVVDRQSSARLTDCTRKVDVPDAGRGDV